MNIYAILDTMIEYFMPPFLAPSDKEAMAAIAHVVNSEGDHAITKAPEDFQIWRLGEIKETGEVKGPPQCLARCDSFLRGNIRQRGTGEPGTDQAKGLPDARRSTPSGDQVRPATGGSALQGASQTAHIPAGDAH